MSDPKNKDDGEDWNEDTAENEYEKEGAEDEDNR